MGPVWGGYETSPPPPGGLSVPGGGTSFVEGMHEGGVPNGGLEPSSYCIVFLFFFEGNRHRGNKRGRMQRRYVVRLWANRG